MQTGTRRWMLRGAAAVAALSGALTIKSGGSALFGDGAAGGHYASFVIWFNFLAGFAYLAAAPGLWFGQRWSARLALCLAVFTVAVFGVFGVHIASGGLFEARAEAEFLQQVLDVHLDRGFGNVEVARDQLVR